MFNYDYKLWKRRDPSDKTWTQFKNVFATTHQELSESQATTTGAGYHAANHVDQHSANHVYRQETVDVIANLATATARYCASIETHTAINSTLAAVLTLRNRKLVIALQDVSCLTGTIAELRRKLGYTNPANAPEVGWAKCHYCWTCRYACEHSSHD